MRWCDFQVGDVIVDSDLREDSAFVVLDRDESMIRWLCLYTITVVNSISSDSKETVPSYWLVFKRNCAQ